MPSRGVIASLPEYSTVVVLLPLAKCSSWLRRHPIGGFRDADDFTGPAQG